MVPKNCGQLQGEKAEVRHITHQRDDEPGKGSKELEDDYFSGVTLGEKKEEITINLLKEMKKRIIKVASVKSTIIRMDTVLDIAINVIQIFVPVKATEERKMSEFYEELQTTVDKITEDNNKIVIIGDWNARIGKDRSKDVGSMRPYGQQIMNRNWKENQ